MSLPFRLDLVGAKFIIFTLLRYGDAMNDLQIDVSRGWQIRRMPESMSYPLILTVRSLYVLILAMVQIADHDLTAHDQGCRLAHPRVGQRDPTASPQP